MTAILKALAALWAMTAPCPKCGEPAAWGCRPWCQDKGVKR